MTNAWITKTRPFAWALAVALVALLALAAACGDDDSDSNGNGGDGSVTATEAASGDASETPDGTAVETPAGTAGEPAECAPADEDHGIVTQLEFSGDDGHYDQGEEVEITLTIANCAENVARLFFPTAQRYVMFAENDESGTEVWRSDDGLSFEQVEEEVEIAPNETLVYTETWDLTDRDGNAVPAGLYKISAFSVGCGQEGATDCEFGLVRNIQVNE